MTDVRKGILTPEQEVKVDTIIKLKNPVLEMVDGPIIRTVDNVFLEKLMTYLEEKYPEYVQYVYEGVDAVIESL
jgi:hypothetical protein